MNRIPGEKTADILTALEELENRQSRLLREMRQGQSSACSPPKERTPPAEIPRPQPLPQPQSQSQPIYIKELKAEIEPQPQSHPPSRPRNRKTKQPKPRSKLRQIISAAAFYGLLICLIGGAFLISRGEKQMVLGYSFMNVLTWSMESEIPQGSLVVIKRTDPAHIKIGDDITYMRDEKTSVTHRVMGIIEDYEGSGQRGFQTQGIENDTPDFDIVPAVNVVGRVKFHIPRLGGWLEWLGENLVITLLFTAGIILLIILLRGALKKSPADRKNSRFMRPPSMEAV